MNQSRIYFDYQATTPVDPRVVEKMLPFFSKIYGNSASRQHRWGWQAEATVEQARQMLADGIGASPEEIVFTSGATESNNLALKGVAEANADRGRHLIISATEHASVLGPAEALAQMGWEVTRLPVDNQGFVDLGQLEQAIREDTVLVSILWAHNEIGTIQPLEAIASVCREKNVLFHTDAAQAFNSCALDVKQAGVDLLSLSGHKIYGPKGVGALFVDQKRARERLSPLFHGGGHEFGLRSGSLNVPGIIGLGEAFRLAQEERQALNERMRSRTLWFWDILNEGEPGFEWNGPQIGKEGKLSRLPYNLNLTLPGVPATTLMMNLKKIAFSTGSACTSASAEDEPSHVLQAIGRSREEALCSFRLSLGRQTSEEELKRAAQMIRVEGAALQGSG